MAATTHQSLTLRCMAKGLPSMFFRKFVRFPSLFKEGLGVVSVVALLLPTVLPLVLQAESTQTVVINELLWMGSPASSADEWIEFRNLSETAVDLSGWKLTRKSSGQEVAMLTIPSGKTIVPAGYFLMANFAMSSTSTHLAIEPDMVDTAVSLLNSGLEVKLYDASGALVDIADDGSGTPLAGKYVSGETYGSMARNGLPGDGIKKESWHTSATAVNLKSGSIVLGTPRTQNDNVPPVIPALSDQQAAVGETLTFDASDAADPDGDSLQFAWAFGDGGTSEAAAPTHVYTATGTFLGSLEVRDGVGSTGVTFTVTVAALATTTEPPPATGDTLPSNGSVRINELLPNPEGADDDEFIELVADGNADLTGWSLSDASGTTYVFVKGTTIADKQFLVVKREQSKIALNNTGETAQLKNGQGTVVSEVKYADAEESAAYAWDGQTWAWTTTPTPGAANAVVRPNHAPIAKFSASARKRVGQVVKFDASDSSDIDGDQLMYRWSFGDGRQSKGRLAEHTYSQTGQFAVRLTVRDAAGLEDSEERTYAVRAALQSAQEKATGSSQAGSVKGAAIVRDIPGIQAAASSTAVTVKGRVSAAPNVLGSGLLYISDGTKGVAVKSSEVLPKLAVGDGVTVTGKRRTQNGEPYVLVEGSNGIVTDGEHLEVMARAMALESVDTDDLGSLVEATGDVVSISGNRFSIDDGSGELTVYIRSSTGFKRPALRSGDRVRVTGILAKTTSGIRLLPRGKEDVAVVTLAVQPQERSLNVQKSNQPSVWSYILVAFGVVAGTAIGLWRKHRVSAS